MRGTTQCLLRANSGHVTLSTLGRITNWIAIFFAPRVRVAIVSALECDRESSAAQRNNLPLPCSVSFLMLARFEDPLSTGTIVVFMLGHVSTQQSSALGP